MNRRVVEVDVPKNFPSQREQAVLDFPSNHDLCSLMMFEGDERNAEEFS